MDPNTVEFLFGVLAGTIPSFLIVKRSRRKTPPLEILRNVKSIPAKPRRSQRQTKILHVRSRRLRPRRTMSKGISSDVVQEASTSPLGQQVVMLACPSCGLEAP